MPGPDGDSKSPRSGRVVHDPSGRAVWEWAVDSGRFAVESTSRLLKKLDLTSITLMGEEAKGWDESSPEGSFPDDPRSRAERMATAPGDRPGKQEKTFNPYDARPQGRAPAPTAPARPRITQPVRQSPPPPPPGFLSRLFSRK